jgi:hypothetical protein
MCATKAVTGPQWDKMSAPLLQGIAGGTDIPTYLRMGLVSRGMKAALLDVPNPKALRDLVDDEYPLLSERVELLSEEERNDVFKRLRFFKRIDRNMAQGIFYSSELMPGHWIRPRVSFHGSRMYCCAGSVISETRLGLVSNGKQLPFATTGVTSTMKDSVVIAANDKYFAKSMVASVPYESSCFLVEIYDCTTRKHFTTIPFNGLISALCFDCEGNLIAGTTDGEIYKADLSKAQFSDGKDKEHTDAVEKVTPELLYHPPEFRRQFNTFCATKSHLYVGTSQSSGERRVGTFDWATKELTLWAASFEHNITKIIPRPSGRAIVISGGRIYECSESSHANASVVDTVISDTYFCLSDRKMFTRCKDKLRVTAPFDFSSKPIQELSKAPSFAAFIDRNVLADSIHYDISLLHCDGARLVYEERRNVEGVPGIFYKMCDYAVPILAERSRREKQDSSDQKTNDSKKKDSSADRKEPSANGGSN